MAIKKGNKRINITLTAEEVNQINDLKAKYGLSTTQIFKRALELLCENEKIGSVFKNK